MSRSGTSRCGPTGWCRGEVPGPPSSTRAVRCRCRSTPTSRARARSTSRFQADGYLRSPLIRVAPVPGRRGRPRSDRSGPGAVVRGRLFDAASAEPAAGCLVELLLAGGGPAIQTARVRDQHLAVSDADGEYLLGGLEAGRYHLRLQCPDVPVADRFLALGANELADQGETWLHPGRRVAVLVSGLGGGTVRLLDRFRESGGADRRHAAAVLGRSRRRGAERRGNECSGRVPGRSRHLSPGGGG